MMTLTPRRDTGQLLDSPPFARTRLVLQEEATWVRQKAREWLASLLTMQQVQKLFRRSELTISLWIKNDGLPVVRIEGDKRDTLRFDRAEVSQWARDKGKRIYLDTSQDAA